MALPSNPDEGRLLGDVGVLAQRLRTLRSATPRPDASQIDAVEAQISLKWQQLRLLRAGPVNAEAHWPARRSLRE